LQKVRKEEKNPTKKKRRKIGSLKTTTCVGSSGTGKGGGAQRNAI